MSLQKSFLLLVLICSLIWLFLSFFSQTNMGVASSTSHTSDPVQLNEAERTGVSIAAESEASSSSSADETAGPIVPVDSADYYNHYFGHRISELTTVVRNLRRLGKEQIIFLVGDSSLDNKYWLRGKRPACSSYSQFLLPPKSVPDVAYWLNVELEARGYTRTAVVNAAIEESTLGDRQNSQLRKQDLFVRDSLQPSDIIVMSVGGNDIALKVCTSLCSLSAPLRPFMSLTELLASLKNEQPSVDSSSPHPRRSSTF